MEKLNEILGKLLEWLEAAEGFTIDQAPLVLQEIITWKIAAAILALIICFCFVGFWAIFYWVNRGNLIETNDYGSEPTVYGGFAIGGGIASIFVLLFPGLIHTFELLQLYLAPRAYLIEYVSRLLKGD